MQVRDNKGTSLDHFMVQRVLEKLSKFNQIMDMVSRHRSRSITEFIVTNTEIDEATFLVKSKQRLWTRG